MTVTTARATAANWAEPDGIAPRGTLIVIPGRGEGPELYERFGRRIAGDAHRLHAVADQAAFTALGNPALTRGHPLERHFRDIQCCRIHPPQDDAALIAVGRRTLTTQPPDPPPQPPPTNSSHLGHPGHYDHPGRAMITKDFFLAKENYRIAT